MEFQGSKITKVGKEHGFSGNGSYGAMGLQLFNKAVSLWQLTKKFLNDEINDADRDQADGDEAGP